MIFEPASAATCLAILPVDLSDPRTIAQIDKVLSPPWHFSEVSRCIYVDDLPPVRACYTGDQASVAETLAPLVADALRAAGWALRLHQGPRWIHVLRPANLPPAVRHVDGAWAPIVPVVSALPEETA